MILKASLIATAVIAATVTLTSVDFRDLYNEMYPVNGLKRDVLGLCHVAKPTFVRAIRSDRDNCYDSMPDPVELAIGWIRSSSRLADLNKTPTAIELAERLLAQAALQGRVGTVPEFTGYVPTPAASRPCPDTKGLAPLADHDLRTAKPEDRLVRRVAGNDDAALSALGLSPRGPKPTAMREQNLPTLPLNGAAPAAAVETAATGCKV